MMHDDSDNNDDSDVLTFTSSISVSNIVYNIHPNLFKHLFDTLKVHPNLFKHLFDTLKVHPNLFKHLFDTLKVHPPPPIKDEDINTFQLLTHFRYKVIV